MNHRAQRIAELASALASREKQAEELWAELKKDILHQPELTRKYCACLRLCEWIQKQLTAPRPKDRLTQCES